MSEWRPIPSLPGWSASKYGLIRQEPFVSEAGGNRKNYGGGPARAGVWQKMGVSGQGRYILTHRGKNYRVARLVCEAFHGPPPFEGAVCMHIDEDSRNNRADNLAWGTQRENMNAPRLKAWQRTRVGENSPTIKGRRKRSGDPHV